MKSFITLLLIMPAFSHTSSWHEPDEIIGCWMNTENNLEVEVFKAGVEYKARVVWFDDSDDKDEPMNVRCDKKNPNALLRTRKVIGLEVMQGLIYNSKSDEWGSGVIYDSSSGKTWSAKAYLSNDNCLTVRGFWNFEFLGQNIRFKKISPIN